MYSKCPDVDNSEFLFICLKGSSVRLRRRAHCSLVPLEKPEVRLKETVSV